MLSERAHNTDNDNEPEYLMKLHIGPGSSKLRRFTSIQLHLNGLNLMKLAIRNSLLIFTKSTRLMVQHFR